MSAPDDADLGDRAQTVLDVLSRGGAYFFRALADAVEASDTEVVDALWSLAWSGRVSGDTFTPVRALLAGGRTAHKRATSGPLDELCGRTGPSARSVSSGGSHLT